MPDTSLWTEIGISAKDLYGGLAGGALNAIIFQKTHWAAVLASVGAGGLTAAWLTPAATAYLGTLGGAASFIVGLCAMAICQAITAAVGKWVPKLPGGQP